MSGILKSNRGTTLIELSVAMLVSSIVVAGAYQAYEYVTRSTQRENDKALLQRDIITIMELVGKDIRSAGIGLPGNGIQVTLSESESDMLYIYQNETKTATTLKNSLNYDATSILVTDCSGAKAGGSVCVAGVGLDTVYCPISRVGNDVSAGGVDTVYLTGVAGAGVFQVASTTVYFCHKKVYKINKTGSSASFVLQHDALESPLGERIDSLNITPKDEDGVVLTSDYNLTRSIDIFVGGYVGSGANRQLMSEQTMVSIRNKD